MTLTDERIAKLWNATVHLHPTSWMHQHLNAFARAIAAEVAAPIPDSADSTSLPGHARTTDTPTQVLTDDQLADAIPQTATILESGEVRKVCMTRTELHEFIVNGIRLAGGKESGE